MAFDLSPPPLTPDLSSHPAGRGACAAGREKGREGESVGGKEREGDRERERVSVCVCERERETGVGGVGREGPCRTRAASRSSSEYLQPTCNVKIISS